MTSLGMARTVEVGQSRFAGLPRTAAAGLLALVAILIALGLWIPTSTAPAVAKGTQTDLALYQAIVKRVRNGEPYEHAAVAEQRARGYPLKPFFVVRPPTLAVLLAAIANGRIAQALETLLAAAVIFAWTVRLRALGPGAPWMAWTACSLFTGVGASMAGGAVTEFTEIWAGLLVALSLAARTERRFAVAVILGLAAALVRELAMPYLLAMTFFAAIERRRAEAISFAAALIVAVGALAWHAHDVGALVTPQDSSSPGWLSLGGVSFVRATEYWILIVPLVGSWATAAIAPLALMGAGSWKGATGIRLLSVLVGYLCAFLLVGRPDNAYWGFLIAPLLAVGLSLAPLALYDLIRRGILRTTDA